MYTILDERFLPHVGLGLLLAAIGVLVLAARPRDAPNVFFGAFMALLGGGLVLSGVSLAETYNLHLLEAPGSGASAAEIDAQASRAVLAQRLFWVLYALDPLALIAFAGVFPRRGAALTHRALVPFALVGLPLVAFAALAPAFHPPGRVELAGALVPIGEAAWRPVLVTYTLLAYATVVIALGALLARGDHETVEARARLLFVGLNVAVATRVGLAIGEQPGVYLVVATRFRDAAPLAMRAVEMVVAGGVALALFAWLARRSTPAGRASLARAERLSLALLAALAATYLAAAATFLLDDPGSVRDAGRFLDRIRYSARWIPFAALTAYALLRYQLFDLGDRARAIAADAGASALAVAAFGAFGLGVTFLAQGNPLAPLPSLVASTLAAIVVIVAFSRARGALRARAAGAGTDEERRLRRLEVYRAAVEAGADARALGSLRASLALGEDEAAIVERLARAPRAGGALLPGVIVASRYEVAHLAGRGGGGRVFVARDLLLDRLVVLKHVGDGIAPRGTLSALAEARAAGSLNHPNVVTVHDVVKWGEEHVIVMEHVAGGSLADAPSSWARPREASVLAVSDALAGLAAAHERGLVHGDVKPSNVLVDAHGRAKVADFGLARSTAATTRALGPAGGTWGYAAPEVVAGGRASTASDVYGLGVVALEIVPADARPPGSAIARVLARATARAPEDRFASAVEMRAAFLDATREAPLQSSQ